MAVVLQHWSRQDERGDRERGYDAEHTPCARASRGQGVRVGPRRLARTGFLHGRGFGRCGERLGRGRCGRIPGVVERLQAVVERIVDGSCRISIVRKLLGADLMSMTSVGRGLSGLTHLICGRVRNADPDRQRGSSRNFRRRGRLLRQYEAQLISRVCRLMFDGGVEARRPQLVDRRDRRLADQIGNSPAALRSPTRLFCTTAFGLRSVD